MSNYTVLEGDAAFDFMSREDPFSGHVVIRSTDSETPGSAFRLWTTIKVPQGHSMQAHCELLAGIVGAEAFRIMPAKRPAAHSASMMRAFSSAVIITILVRPSSSNSGKSDARATGRSSNSSRHDLSER